MSPRLPGVTDLGEMPLSERLAPAAAGGDRLQALADAGRALPHVAAPGGAIPQDLILDKSGKPFKDKTINLAVAQSIKRGRNVEAVQIGPNQWGMRPVVDEGPKTGGKKQRAAIEKELAAVRVQGYDAMRDRAEAMIDAGQDVDVVYDVLAGMEEEEEQGPPPKRVREAQKGGKKQKPEANPAEGLAAMFSDGLDPVPLADVPEGWTLVAADKGRGDNYTRIRYSNGEREVEVYPFNRVLGVRLGDARTRKRHYDVGVGSVEEANRVARELMEKGPPQKAARPSAEQAFEEGRAAALAGGSIDHTPAWGEGLGKENLLVVWRAGWEAGAEERKQTEAPATAYAPAGSGISRQEGASGKDITTPAPEGKAQDAPWDDFTERHFQNWLRKEPASERAEIERDIKDFARKYPDEVGHKPWPDIMELAQNHAERNRRNTKAQASAGEIIKAAMVRTLFDPDGDPRTIKVERNTLDTVTVKVRRGNAWGYLTHDGGWKRKPQGLHQLDNALAKDVLARAGYPVKDIWPARYTEYSRAEVAKPSPASLGFSTGNPSLLKAEYKGGPAWMNGVMADRGEPPFKAKPEDFLLPEAAQKSPVDIGPFLAKATRNDPELKPVAFAHSLSKMVVFEASDGELVYGPAKDFGYFLHKYGADGVRLHQSHAGPKSHASHLEGPIVVYTDKGLEPVGGFMPMWMKDAPRDLGALREEMAKDAEMPKATPTPQAAEAGGRQEQPQFSRAKSLNGIDPSAGKDALVLAPSGGLDYGFIDETVAKAVGGKSAPIRLLNGDATEGGVHLEMRHGSQFKHLKYPDSRSFVEDVARNFDAVFAAEGRALYLVKRADLPWKSATIKLEFDSQGDFYKVQTAHPIRWSKFLNNDGTLKQKPLWESTPNFQRVSPLRGELSGQKGSEKALDASKADISTNAGKRNPHAPAAPLDRTTLDRTLGALQRAASGSAPAVSYDDHAEAREHLRGVDIPDDARAFYWKGEVHIIASMFDSKRDLAEAWAHEQLRHHGFRAFLGRDYRVVMKEAWSNRAVREKARELFEQGYTDIKTFMRVNGRVVPNPKATALDRIHAADEAIAHLADGGWKSGVLDRIIAAVRGVLRRAGLEMKWSDAEIRSLISASAQQVAYGGRKPWARQFGDALAPAFQRVYHGSPHRGIEKNGGFSTKYIGTGEGAQAYGWGMYFAGKKEVAEWYRENLAAREDANKDISRIVNGDRYTFTNNGWFDEENEAHVDDRDPYALALEADRLGVDLDEQLRDLEADPDPLLEWPTQIEDIREAAKVQVEMAENGQLYEVEIPEDHELLDWDRPLSEQPTGVREKLEAAGRLHDGKEKYVEDLRERAQEDFDENGPMGFSQERFERALNEAIESGDYGEEFGAGVWHELKEAAPGINWKEVRNELSHSGVQSTTGKGIYHDLSRELGSDKAASKYLASIGIPGLRYLDGDSRGKGEGHHNYVIFQDDMVDIARVHYQRVRHGAISEKEPADRLVPAPDGGVDFGSVPEDAARAIGWKAGPIRLFNGDAREGGVHIERRHLKQIKQQGFPGVREFVAKVAQGFDAIFQGKDRAFYLTVRGEKPWQTATVKMEFDPDGDFWKVQSAAPMRPDYFMARDGVEKKKLLWERAQSDHSVAGTPGADSGQSSFATDNAVKEDIFTPGENGKPLFQRVRHSPQTETLEFKKWFGDSKVVDKDGKPLVVYHGGSFDENKNGVPRIPHEGFFLAEDPEVAKSYGSRGKITEAYVSLKNPFTPENPGHVNAKWVKDWIDFWRDEEGWTDRHTGEEMSDYDVLQMIEDTRLYEYDSNGKGERWKDFLATARDHHDGFFGHDPTDGTRIAVAFSPTQIKSATGNSGAFDGENPDIRYKRAPLDREARERFGIAADPLRKPLTKDNTKGFLRDLYAKVVNQHEPLLDAFTDKRDRAAMERAGYRLAA